MDIKYIKFNIQDGIGRIQFNRPKKLNALNPDVLWDLETTLVLCEGDESIRVVILTGDEKAFAAGADIEHMSRGDIRAAYELTDHNMRVFQKLADLPKPTIAAVSGYALGGGCEAALCCDFRIASENAVMGLPEITLGIIPGAGGTQRLPRLVGMGPAAELVLTGEMINAERALQIGLVNRVVPLDQLEMEVKALAAKLMARPAPGAAGGQDSHAQGHECVTQ